MRIAISKASGSDKYLMYQSWLHRAGHETEVVDLSALNITDARTALESCCGLIFSGGSDVSPHRYGRAEQAHRCHIDEHRDEQEFAYLEMATQRQMPILGICRGAQVLNVAFGGTLIVDIPEDHRTVVKHGSVGGVDVRHNIEVEPESMLKKICRRVSGEVNSAHHQAVDVLAEEFNVSALAEDGIIEAFETVHAHGKSYILAVQWHPERLEYENPFSRSIAEHFCFECASYSALYKPKSSTTVAKQDE